MSIDKKTHVCSKCINSFDDKYIYVAKVPNREYNTVYCLDCINELGIKEYKSYIKTRCKINSTKKTTTKKTTTKKTTTKKIVTKKQQLKNKKLEL